MEQVGKRGPLTVAILLLAAGALGLALLLREDATPRKGGAGRGGVTAERESEGARGTAEAPRAPDPVYGFAPGDRLSYRFAERQFLDTLPKEGTPGPSADSAAVETDFAGLLVVRVYASDPRGLVAGFAIEQLSASSVTGGKVEGAQDALVREMAREAVVLLEPSGRVARIACASEVGSAGRNLWRDLLSRFEIVRPAGADATGWTTSEEDTTGVYVAEYRVQEAGPLEKRKVRYENFHGGEVALAKAAKIDGRYEFFLDGLLRRIRGREEFDLHPPGEPPLVRSKSEFELDLQRQEWAPVGAAEAAARLARLGEESATTIAGVEIAAAAEESRDARRELDAVEALFRAGARDPADELRAMARLVSALRHDAEVPAEIVRRIDLNPEDADLAALLLGALGAAGTEAAQRAIASVFGAPDREEGQRITALTALVQVERPIPDLDGALLALRPSGGDLAGSAILLLGAVGSRVRDSDPARFSKISDEIYRAAGAENEDLSDRIAAIEAIANLAPTEVPAVVKAAMLSEEELVREAAIHALDKVAVPDALARIREALASDPEERVRLASAQALAARGAALLHTAALKDASEEVRKACLEAIADHEPDEEAMEVVRRSAREDASEDVRKLAESILAR